MLFLNESHIESIGIDWDALIDVVGYACTCLHSRQYAQPVKPYLRYGEPRNRIIAMPAYVGGDIDVAGIKWIASFPGNVEKDLPRAHSIMILNEAATGRPVMVANASLLSTLRVAAVSGLMLRGYLNASNKKRFKLGITGWGPIGRYHYDMARHLLGDKLADCVVYDVASDRRPEHDGKLRAVNRWEEAYTDADIFITCTVSAEAYINLPPKPGSLHLNVSLRDYQPVMCRHFSENIVVDDWTEVCRENTDIERMYREKELSESDTLPLASIVSDWTLLKSGKPIFFNPMGMAVFDVAIADYYYKRALSIGEGVHV
ncbi:2,3-diaminopropionate biosynthesis protein SbnB [Chitinophaga qingshengii]|uniref:2,3-diaminopropionate biosynthesis protein SbnB n=1 Tax=Chitinophaga qingshengii TaxID=1569794 RepID=A0ABR7TFY4_9BACT|nr:2,3-diaminopropionate biosynthesis protein SbnB [Chitinophaga qingshengii]MBC9929287.1 2,3-diaminopropionate biosynthesis protein SbnB [Chitinophaga qingshengii]